VGGDLFNTCTSLVNGWTHGTAADNGLALGASASDSYGWKKFASQASGTGNPFLAITYTTDGASYKLASRKPVVAVTPSQNGKFAVRVTNTDPAPGPPATGMRSPTGRTSLCDDKGNVAWYAGYRLREDFAHAVKNARNNDLKFSPCAKSSRSWTPPWMPDRGPRGKSVMPGAGSAWLVTACAARRLPLRPVTAPPGHRRRGAGGDLRRGSG
jgi:hypothetical protein